MITDKFFDYQFESLVKPPIRRQFCDLLGVPKTRKINVNELILPLLFRFFLFAKTQKRLII